MSLLGKFHATSHLLRKLTAAREQHLRYSKATLSCRYLNYAFDPFNCGVHTQARELTFFYFNTNLKVFILGNLQEI